MPGALLAGRLLGILLHRRPAGVGHKRPPAALPTGRRMVYRPHCTSSENNRGATGPPRLGIIQVSASHRIQKHVARTLLQTCPERFYATSNEIPPRGVCSRLFCSEVAGKADVTASSRRIEVLLRACSRSRKSESSPARADLQPQGTEGRQLRSARGGNMLEVCTAHRVHNCATQYKIIQAHPISGTNLQSAPSRPLDLIPPWANIHATCHPHPNGTQKRPPVTCEAPATG